MKYVFICALLAVSFLHSSCREKKQTSPPPTATWRHRSGLPESQLKEAAKSKVPMSMVRAIKQARNGDILVASYIGIYRYDGKSFTNITRSINWPTFWDVLEDRKGNLWLASQDSGVYRYDGTSFHLFSAKDGIPSALNAYEDRAGNLWFGSVRYDGKSFRTLTTKDGFPSNHIRLLLEDKTGRLWFGAQGEDLFVYDGKTFTVLKNKDGRTFKNVWSVIEDKKGNTWFGDVNGLWRYDGSTFTNVSRKGVYAIIEDRKGNIWTTGGRGLSAGGQDWVVSRYDQKSLYDQNPRVTEIVSGGPAFLALLEANDGSIWFGSMKGVYRYDGKTVTDFNNEAVRK